MWHIITPEYPPNLGGVADYSALVARGLREAGQAVHVWCRAPEKSGTALEEWVHPQVHGMGLRGLREIGNGLNRFARPRKLLVQWVPHGYGWRAMNVAFCVWIVLRAVRGDDVEIMLHEAFLPFHERNWRQNIAAAVQRLMTMILFRSTRRIWISSPSWERRLRPYSLGKEMDFIWLPVPSTIPVLATKEAVADLKAVYAPNRELLLGHFGTYGRSVSEMLDKIVPPLLLANPNCKLLLIGANSDSYQASVLVRYPDLVNRVLATGASDASAISRSLMVCDLMVQPYPDGVTARRTTCLAGLSHGKAIVTTSGEMTETFWYRSPAPVAFSTDCAGTISVVNQLLSNRSERQSLGTRAQNFYRDNFALEHLIRMLQFDAQQ